VLNYIGPTLEKHKGCDILDINPGACLWSQKLHDFLKPRSHVLLENSPDIFQGFLDPLLNAPDSKYKLVAKDPLDLSSYRDIVNEDTFPHQTRVDPTDPKAQDPNNTLLVTGSLVWDPNLPGLGFDSMAKQLCHHFAAAAWTNDLFHAYGPVRTLFWVQSEDFSPMIAQATSGMHRSNRLLEMTQDLNQVVGSERKVRPAGRAALGREPQYELESAVRALRAGTERGIEIPPHRRDSTYDVAKHIEEVSGGTGISSVGFIQPLLHTRHLEGKAVTGILPQSFIETIESEKRLRNEYPDLPFNPPGVYPSIKGPSPKGHPAQKMIVQFKKAHSLAQNIVKGKAVIESIADIGEQMYLLECKALRMVEGPPKESIVKQIEELDLRWDRSIEALAENYKLAPLGELDDRISLRHSAQPRIQWDHRPFLPLMLHEDEAWPRNRLSLVSASPKPKPLGDGDDWAEWVYDFVYAIYSDPIKPIAFALETMQHGLSEVIKNCPSLTDPDKGGRMQMKHLRVRMLTMDMIDELVKAYRDWPFKAPGTDHSRYFRHKSSKGGVRNELRMNIR